ncbi:hypothetical protein Syun_021306 [Stephania yunnanensis]|uniref:Pentatricopeptide repeat-containing protein n=1 Tax=Stephania yunnanensis TaxID=152371 RepID=A0AAP0IFD7_9MAGN
MLSKRMVGLCKSNRVRSAIQLYVSMEVAGVDPTPHACNSLISSLCRNGSVDKALKVFDKMKERRRTTCHTYSLVLKEIARVRGFDFTMEMFADWEGEEMVRRRFDAVVYNTMMSICGEVNRWVETERMWRSLNPELAFKAYIEMVKSGMIPTENTAQAVVGACTKEGKWELALSVYESMLGFELKPNEVIYNALINSLGKAGEVRSAFKLFDCMRSSGYTPNAYTWNALIVALNREKRYGDALRLFNSVEKQMNLHLYNSALVSCQKLGLWDRSLQLLWKMEVSRLSVSTASYNLAISTCEAARKPRIALEVYERMVHKNCIPDTFTYMSLIRACIWGSLLSEALELLDGMCLQGKVVMAKKLYSRMRESGMKADGKTRAMMLQNLTKH